MHTHTLILFHLETVSVFYCCSDNQNILEVKLYTESSTVMYDWWTGSRTRVRHERFWDCWERMTLCRSKRRHAEMKIWRAFFASPPFWCFSAHLSFRITGLFRLDVWTGGQHACEARLDASFPSVFHFYDFFIFLYLFIMVVCHSMSSLFLYLCLPAHWGPTGCKQICPVRLCCILKKEFFLWKILWNKELDHVEWWMNWWRVWGLRNLWCVSQEFEGSTFCCHMF